MSNKYLYTILIIVTVASFGLGWLLSDNSHVQSEVDNGSLLRNHDFQFTSPLLLSDFGDTFTSSIYQPLQSKIISYTENVKNEGISDVSVFLRDLTENDQLVVDGSIKYFPASLSKVPLMMAYFKLGEVKSDLLNSPKKIEISQDYNANMEVPPKDAPRSGKQYSINQLIEYMIKYSDNASFNLLFARSGTDKELRDIFDDLDLYYPYDQALVKDVWTAQEYSKFLRLLYNSTYLNESDSEKALKLMGESEYDNGITAGVPDEVVVSNKYGLHTQRSESGVLIGRQLHDCGIIYAPEKPYLLCVMTKSGVTELANVEKVIADISRMVYEELTKK